MTGSPIAADRDGIRYLSGAIPAAVEGGHHGGRTLQPAHERVHVRRVGGPAHGVVEGADVVGGRDRPGEVADAVRSAAMGESVMAALLVCVGHRLRHARRGRVPPSCRIE